VEITATNGHKTGNISAWSAVEEAEVYEIYRAAQDGEAALVAETHALAYKDTTAEPGVTYTYTVRAVAGEFIGDFSEGVDVTRALETVNITNTIGHKTGNILYWDAVEGAQTYVVYRRTAGNTFEQIARTGSTGYKDTTAEPGVTYIYMVRAAVGYNLSPAYSNQISLVRPE
jgi:fibronectin type 3 domain-containing protein